MKRRRRTPKKLDSRLIVRRRAQPPLHRATWSLVTLLAWLFYAYLWLPLATAVVWWFGLADIYGELYQRSEQVDRFVVFALPAAAAITGFALIGWAEYNRLRFRGNERRAPFRDVPIDEIAAALGASPGVPHALAEVRVAILDMNEDAEPVAVIPVLPVDRRSPA